MFYLEIQSTDQPAYDLVLCRKVGRCFYLVNRPFVFHLSCRCIYLRKMSMLNGVCQLKHDA